MIAAEFHAALAPFAILAGPLLALAAVVYMTLRLNRTQHSRGK